MPGLSLGELAALEAILTALSEDDKLDCSIQRLMLPLMSHMASCYRRVTAATRHQQTGATGADQNADAAAGAGSAMAGVSPEDADGMPGPGKSMQASGGSGAAGTWIGAAGDNSMDVDHVQSGGATLLTGTQNPEGLGAADDPATASHSDSNTSGNNNSSSVNMHSCTDAQQEGAAAQPDEGTTALTTLRSVFTLLSMLAAAKPKEVLSHARLAADVAFSWQVQVRGPRG